MDELRVWPLVGREDELRAIQAALSAGAPGGVVLVGEEGVGKTRLLREALARVASTGDACERVVATRAAASMPLAAVSHLLPADLRPDGNPLLLLGRVARSLAARTGAGPLVVGIDDAHLLDEASAGLLHQLAVRGLLVPVATVRRGEPVSDAFRALWKERARRLHVRPLPPAAVDRLLDHALGGPIDPISRRRLHRLVAGNPLLLRELLADAVESGDLRQRDGFWRWRGAVAGTARLAELAAVRLRAVAPDARRVLETIACGEPLGLSVLERLAAAEAIEAAEHSGIAVAERSGRRLAMRLAHPLYGEALRANLPASRARAVWGQLADVLVQGPLRRHDDALTAGVWELQSGAVRHPAVALAAAQQAMARFDLDLAERLARAARSAGHGWEADWLLAEILTRRDRNQEAIDVLPAPPADGTQLATWAVTRATILYWGLDRVKEAERALLAVPAGTPGKDLAEATRSWILHYDGRCRDALAVAEEVLARPAASDRALVWAAMSGAAAAGMLGRLERATAIAERGRAVARAVTGADRLEWAEAQVGYGLCSALQAAGQVDRARRVAEEGYQAALAGGASEMTGMWAAFLGVAAKAQGRLGDARAALREAVALLEESDQYQIVRICLAELAGVAALSGDAATARAWLQRCDARRRSANRLYDAWVELDRAWVHAAAGAVSTAVELASAAAKLAHDSDQPTFEAVALYDAARLGAAPLAAERLEALAGRIEGRFAPALAAAAAALAGGDGTALEEAAGAFAGDGHLLLAAEAATAAARAHQRNGLGVRMRAALERAATLADQCQGARTPLLGLAGFAASLTRREREVAMLATNLTSRQVADRLGLSVHTVNNTLARVFAKLGVSGRRELAALFGRAGRVRPPAK